jgi:hypothetical protein
MMTVDVPTPGRLGLLPKPDDWAPYGDPGTSPENSSGNGPNAGWSIGRTISDLWSYEDSLGVWVLVDGADWKRISPASDSGHVHMTLLATLAMHENLPADLHEDGNGHIDRLIV